MARSVGWAPANSTSRLPASAVAAWLAASVRSVRRRPTESAASTTGTASSAASPIRQSKLSRNAPIVSGVRTAPIRASARKTVVATRETSPMISCGICPAAGPSNQPNGNARSLSPMRAYRARRQAEDSRNARDPR